MTILEELSLKDKEASILLRVYCKNKKIFTKNKKITARTKKIKTTSIANQFSRFCGLIKKQSISQENL
ncbi:hypothetical protein [Campylobacter pinnipediorum]|uniref:hypothetical protein n=1 Tax=Campylobacter pinnipediorum TaxID=1965231 RepID=UPI00112F9581|nr:hypothetical protein [Campylobacter pinnipediorum]